jgi:hypothetical protein
MLYECKKNAVLWFDVPSSIIRNCMEKECERTHQTIIYLTTLQRRVVKYSAGLKQLESCTNSVGK